jgi:CRP-like cAMP-binding protein
MAGTANLILASLSSADLELLTPHLQPVELKLRQRLEHAHRKIKSVYFIEAGLASVITHGQGNRDRQAEVCLIGREGMTGIAVVLGMDRARTDTFMQIAGAGQCISVADLRYAIARSASLASALLRCVYQYIVQAEETALANAKGRIEERLARWLLMAHDRLGAPDLHLTHEFLSLMLGTRRAGVTSAINELETKGVITAVRRCITIRDREGLEEFAGGLYGATKSLVPALSRV